MSPPSSEEIIGEALIEMGNILRHAGKQLRANAQTRLPIPGLPISDPAHYPNITNASSHQARALTSWVIEQIASRRNLSSDWYQGKSRRPSVIEARHACWYILRCLTGLSTPQLAKVFPETYDHTTVLHGLKKVDNCLRHDPQGYAWVVEIIQACTASEI